MQTFLQQICISLTFFVYFLVGYSFFLLFIYFFSRNVIILLVLESSLVRKSVFFKQCIRIRLYFHRSKMLQLAQNEIIRSYNGPVLRRTNINNNFRCTDERERKRTANKQMAEKGRDRGRDQERKSCVAVGTTAIFISSLQETAMKIKPLMLIIRYNECSNSGKGFSGHHAFTPERCMTTGYKLFHLSCITRRQQQVRDCARQLT